MVDTKQSLQEPHNPLDTAFGPHSRRAEHIRSNTHGAVLEVGESALKHLRLSVISNLCKIAEKYPQALRYFPEGSKLLLSADGDPGDYRESGYLVVYCELIFPGPNGSKRSSGREAVHTSNSEGGVEKHFELFLKQLDSKKLAD